MPLYEYQCSKCGSVFEVIQKFSDEPLKVHEGCGGEVVRLLSAPALQFKGTGWYVTDYGRASSKSGKDEAGKAEASKKDGDKGEAKGEASKSETSKSEAKSESKAESKPAPASKSD